MCMCMSENDRIKKDCEMMINSNNYNINSKDYDKNSNDYVFVDVQGFKTTGNTFIVKEFCLLYGDYKFHAHVQSPCTFDELSDMYKCEANWVTNNHHGLLFDSGDMTLSELAEKTVEYVNGEKKTRWL